MKNELSVNYKPKYIRVISRLFYSLTSNTLENISQWKIPRILRKIYTKNSYQKTSEQHGSRIDSGFRHWPQKERILARSITKLRRRTTTTIAAAGTFWDNFWRIKSMQCNPKPTEERSSRWAGVVDIFRTANNESSRESKSLCVVCFLRVQVHNTPHNRMLNNVCRLSTLVGCLRRLPIPLYTSLCANAIFFSFTKYHFFSLQRC